MRPNEIRNPVLISSWAQIRTHNDLKRYRSMLHVLVRVLDLFERNFPLW